MVVDRIHYGIVAEYVPDGQSSRAVAHRHSRHSVPRTGMQKGLIYIEQRIDFDIISGFWSVSDARLGVPTPLLTHHVGLI